MPFDVANDLLSDIITAFVDDFNARGDSLTNFAKTNGITYQQAWTLIQMSKNLPSK